MLTDLQLQQAVLDELAFDPSFDAAHIGVAAEKGVIALSGHVGSYAAKHAALDAARRVAGVRAVADEIEVRYASEKKSSDDEIAKRAANILAWDTLVPAGAIQITVRNGWITLTGNVDWHYQRMSAEQDVRKLSGVLGVINSVEIRPQLDAGDVKLKIEETLRRRADVEANGIRVIVDDQNQVRLEGRVRNWDERLAVESAAWATAGVSSVDDRLAID